MLIMITGGSGSGKSAYAEDLVCRLGEGKRIYIATMMSYDEEGDRRIERHRKMRVQKEFETVECYTGLKKLELPSDGIVLLECMSNLAANEMYAANGAGDHTPKEILNGIRSVCAQVRHVVLVTNEVFSDGQEYEGDTMRYLSYLGFVNQQIGAEADKVVEVVCGIPLILKEGTEDEENFG